MAANIAAIRAGVVGADEKHGRVQDTDSVLSTTPALTCDVDLAILSAKEQYEKLRPRRLSVALAGADDYVYAVSLLTGGSPAGSYVPGFSTVLAVHYPYAVGSVLPDPILREFYGEEPLDDEMVLRFRAHMPAAGEQFLVTFTAPHILNATQSTVPAGDDQALMDLAAANCCDMLAAHYAKDVDSSISADSVDRRTKSDTYRSQATGYRRAYETKMGIGTAAAVGGGLRYRRLVRA